MSKLLCSLCKNNVNFLSNQKCGARYNKFHDQLDYKRKKKRKKERNKRKKQTKKKERKKEIKKERQKL